MLCSLIWIIEVVFVIINGINAVDSFSTANELKNDSLTSNFSEIYKKIGISYIISIAVSLVFCIAITIAYKTSQDNKEKHKSASKNINNINNYLEKLSNAIQSAKNKTQSVNTTNETESNSTTNHEDKSK